MIIKGFNVDRKDTLVFMVQARIEEYKGGGKEALVEKGENILTELSHPLIPSSIDLIFRRYPTILQAAKYFLFGVAA